MENNIRTRREFLKNAGRIAGAGVILSSYPIIEACAAQDTKRLGVALVGLGNYSTTMLGPALRKTERCHLSGIITGTPSKAKEWSSAYAIPEKNIYSYETFDEIANNPDIDIVYVVLPNSMHAEYTIRALQAGKHAICEKPMALNANEARQMVDAATKANRKLAIGYRMHYDPYFIEAKRLGQNETFGPVNYLECALGYSFTPERGSWKLKRNMGGGSLYNLGVYPIQSARHTKGAEPVYVTAQATTKRKNIFTEVDEIFTWQLEFADGTLCNSYAGPVAKIDRLFAGCTNGFIELDPCTPYTGQAGQTSNGVLNFEQVFQQQLQIDDFARCVAENKESIVKGEDGLLDMLIVDAIHEGIGSGRKVKVGAI
ncbi:MAG TPA: Gfo/Idh/MocA family oxidoreductase [Cyclobacteriaceae bacterium]